MSTRRSEKRDQADGLRRRSLATHEATFTRGRGRLIACARACGLALSALVMVTLAACTRTVEPPPEPPPPPPPPPEQVDQLDVFANVPVAGGQLLLDRPADLVSMRVDPLLADLQLRVAIDRDAIRIAWVGAEPEVGSHLRLSLDFGEESGSVPLILERLALADADGGDLGDAALELTDPEALEAAGTGLRVSSVDHASVANYELSPTFADYELGDLSADGAIDVRDALRLLKRVDDGLWTGFELYHSDLDGNDATDGQDLGRLLDKIVDPSLPASMIADPGEISFVQLDPATDRDGLVLIANAGRAPLGPVDWEVPNGIEWTEVGGIPGQSLALRLSLPEAARPGWLPGFMTIGHADQQASIRLGHLVVMVAGQSNATGVGQPLYGWPETPRPEVRLFGNDFYWRNAEEPMDDASDPLPDDVSQDSITLYSIGTRLGNLLYDATGFVTYLVPSTRNGSSMHQTDGWVIGTDVFDRSTLVGWTLFRARVSAGIETNPVGATSPGSEGGPPSVLVWYQGESDAASASVRDPFQKRTREVMDALQGELGVPVVYVQLASDHDAQANLKLHAVAELQREMETSFGTPSQARESYPFHMVPAYDLPRSDQIHLSAFGHRVLAERVQLAIREHVLGEPVDGTGPRRTELRWVDDQIYIGTTHELDAGPMDPAYFTVFEGPPDGQLDDIDGYGANTVGIEAVERDPDNPTGVRVTLSRVPSTTPYVRYMSPPNLYASATSPNSGTWEDLADGIVRAAAGGLPLPVFGPEPVD